MLVFVGASQRRIDINVAAALDSLGTRTDYVRVSGVAPDALDFHIAYQLGAWP